jgi:hypothetical protein
MVRTPRLGRAPVHAEKGTSATKRIVAPRGHGESIGEGQAGRGHQPSTLNPEPRSKPGWKKTSEFSVQGSGVEVEGSGFRVKGLEVTG